jgi:hypothetical protein
MQTFREVSDAIGLSQAITLRNYCKKWLNRNLATALAASGAAAAVARMAELTSCAANWTREREREKTKKRSALHE